MMPADAVRPFAGRQGEGDYEMIHAFPKIFTVGQTYITKLFEGDVEITEKIDGSQFVFGNINGTLYARSKGAEQQLNAPDKMFKIATDYIQGLTLPDGVVFFCEYLQKPKHNTLCYERVPKNNLILFGVCKWPDTFVSDYETLTDFANDLGIETVPLIFKGQVDNAESLLALLERSSVLGKTNIEGLVVKNYSQPFLLGGQPIPIMAGKLVSEKFKETHREKWGKENTSKGKWETFKESFRTDARWEKAIQHLQEKGLLQNAPQDIGNLIKEVKTDIENEEIDDIKAFLWREFGDDILRKAVAGLPQWYKERLVQNQFGKSLGEKEMRRIIHERS